MSVRRLLAEMDSYELSSWQVFFSVDAERREEAAEQAKRDRDLVGDG